MGNGFNGICPSLDQFCLTLSTSETTYRLFGHAHTMQRLRHLNFADLTLTRCLNVSANYRKLERLCPGALNAAKCDDMNPECLSGCF